MNCQHNRIHDDPSPKCVSCNANVCAICHVGLVHPIGLCGPCADNPDPRARHTVSRPKATIETSLLRGYLWAHIILIPPLVVTLALHDHFGVAIIYGIGWPFAIMALRRRSTIGGAADL